jgi:phenylacetate-CoA ligase
VSYHPYFKYFEVVGGQLVFTAFSGIPLVRYAIGDVGGLLSYEKAVSICRDHGYKLAEALADARCAQFHFRLPLAYLWGRRNGIVTYIGLNVYPDPIARTLAEPRWLPYFTGRFRMEVVDDAKFDQVFRIHVELGPGKQIAPAEVAALQDAFDRCLQEANAEYREARRSFRNARPPEVVCWPHGDPRHFSPRIKQRAT